MGWKIHISQEVWGGWLERKKDRREKGHLRALQEGEAATQLAEWAVIGAVCRRGGVLQQQPRRHVLACKITT